MKREIKTTLALDGEKAFKQGLEATSRQLRVLDSEMKATKASFAGNEKSLESLTARGKIFEKQVAQQKEVVAALSRAVQESAQKYGEADKRTDGYRIKLNNATAALAKMESELKQNSQAIQDFGKNADTAASKLDKLKANAQQMSESMINAGDKIASTGDKLTTRVTAPIIAAGAASSKFAIDFENGMAKVGTIADTAAVPIDKLRKQILDLSNKTGVSAADLAEAEYNAISAGVDTAKSVEFLSTAVKAAKGGFTDTNTAIDGLTTTLNAYGKTADEVMKISDQMMLAQNFGKTTFGEMASNIGNVAPTASSLNVATEDLFGSLAVLTKNGIATSQAVTGLKAAFSNILKPASAAADLAEELGLDFSAARLKSVGWAKFLDEIAEKTGGDAEKMALLFGSVEALNSMLVLTGKGAEDFDKVLENMGSSAGMTEEAYRKMDTRGAKLTKSLNSLKNAGIELGDTLAPAIETISNSIAGMANAFQKLGPAGTKLVIILAAIAAAVGPVMVVVGNLMKLFGGIIGFFAPGADGVSKFSKALKFIAPVARVALGAIRLLVGAISWPVVVITGLIAAGIALYKNWDTIKAKAAEIGGKISESWNNLKASASAAWDGVKSAVVGAWDWMYAHNYYFQKIVDAVTTAWSAIKGVTGPAWDSIKSVTEAVWNAISEYLSGLWEGIKGQAQSAWGTIYGVVSGILDSISGAFDATLGKAWEWGKNLLGQFIDGIKARLGSLKDTLYEIGQAIWAFLGFHSPTKMGPGRDADKWAPNLIGMFKKGLESGIPDIEKTMSKLAGMMEFEPVEIMNTMRMTGGLTVKVTGEGAQYLSEDRIARAAEQLMLERMAIDSRRYAPIPKTIPFG